MFVGFSLDVGLMFVGSSLDVRRMFVGCSLDVTWLFMSEGSQKLKVGSPPQTLDPKCETETDDEDNDKTLTRSGCKSLG